MIALTARTKSNRSRSNPSGVSTHLKALCLLVAGGLATALWASADLMPPPPSGDGGSDPTVGTLPMVGDVDAEFFDQTITLRGPATAVDAAIVFEGGVGAREVIDLGDGDVWIRFYGDIQLELDLAKLSSIEVEIFTGFEGNGMSYKVGGTNGFGSVRHLGPGGEIGLDPQRLADMGLLDDTLFLMGLHQSGQRTQTSAELLPNDGHVILRQDV